MTEDDNETDRVEAALIIVGFLAAVALLLTKGFISASAARDVAEMLPDPDSLGFYGQSAYVIVWGVSWGGAGLRRLRKQHLI